MRIDKDSWKIVEFVIMRYPERKKEYEEYIESVMSSTSRTEEGYTGSSAEYIRPQSVTEAKAMKLTNEYITKLEREIRAVESVYAGLNEEEKKIMRIRYWSNRRKKVPYGKMVAVSYSERQMKRIVYKIITLVGRKIGEINEKMA